MAAESPTNKTGIPASSKTLALSASYEVIIGHFSPRAFAAIKSLVVIRRDCFPPYKGSEVIS